MQLVMRGVKVGDYVHSRGAKPGGPDPVPSDFPSPASQPASWQPNPIFGKPNLNNRVQNGRLLGHRRRTASASRWALSGSRDIALVTRICVFSNL